MLKWCQRKQGLKSKWDSSGQPWNLCSDLNHLRAWLAMNLFQTTSRKSTGPCACPPICLVLSARLPKGSLSSMPKGSPSSYRIELYYTALWWPWWPGWPAGHYSAFCRSVR